MRGPEVRSHAKATNNGRGWFETGKGRLFAVVSFNCLEQLASPESLVSCVCHVISYSFKYLLSFEDTGSCTAIWTIIYYLPFPDACCA
jgi:hypothetical protein